MQVEEDSWNREQYRMVKAQAKTSEQPSSRQPSAIAGFSPKDSAEEKGEKKGGRDRVNLGDGGLPPKQRIYEKDHGGQDREDAGHAEFTS